MPLLDVQLTLRLLIRLSTGTAVATCVFCGCGGAAARNPRPEIVMAPGSKIEARTAAGRIAITAGDKYLREYSWNGCRKSVVLRARPSRWYGSLGIYYPGTGITWWIPCGGINRAVVDEGQQHFSSRETAARWIHQNKQRHSMSLAYTSDGLVVEWGLEPDRTQLMVNVWQVCISGRKPTDLAGADDSTIEVSPSQTEEGNSGCVDPGPEALDHVLRKREETQHELEKIMHGSSGLGS